MSTITVLLISVTILAVSFLLYFILLRNISRSQRRAGDEAINEAIDKAIKELKEVKELTGNNGQDAA